ncbi:PmoA family protein [Curtobacterium pusillum]|uniref:DUF6807 domain-containing protein n=1 Tax=Curtobacterium pusillum TaxID=69373 RepID=UPI001C92FA38|nr:PmoA family protein [Curtobacterium pusillum]
MTPDAVLHELTVEGTTVASALDGAGTIATSSPRPYLHPVRTLGGAVVSAHHPPDHDWHCGVGFAIPDLDGVNCWGGPTYVRGEGYVRRDDHGRATVAHAGSHGPTLQQEVLWRGPDDAVRLHEDRSLAWRPVDGGWELTWSSSFRTPGDAAVQLGSPGSNGRVGAGYGGFFWRFPPCTDVTVRTIDAAGEAAVHGSVAPWVQWSARFDGGAATVRIEALDHRDPWFVRVAEYPAIGSALAWDQPARVGPGVPLVRSFRATIRD